MREIRLDVCNTGRWSREYGFFSICAHKGHWDQQETPPWGHAHFRDWLLLKRLSMRRSWCRCPQTCGWLAESVPRADIHGPVGPRWRRMLAAPGARTGDFCSHRSRGKQRLGRSFNRASTTVHASREYTSIAKRTSPVQEYYASTLVRQHTQNERSHQLERSVIKLPSAREQPNRFR